MHFLITLQDSVSVHRPRFYARRFEDFMAINLFHGVEQVKSLWGLVVDRCVL